MIVPDITNPHFAALVRSAGRAARETDLQLLLIDTGEHAEEEVRAARTLSHEVDGFVVLSPRRLHRNLAALGASPAVFVNRPVRGHPSIVMRTAAAVGEAVRHLASLGHTEAVYLGGPASSWAAGERGNAVRRTGAAAGLTVHEVAVATPTFEAAAEAVAGDLQPGATAILAFNGQMALGAIAGLAHRGIRVPEDISVVGCDDVPMADMTSFPLTALSLPTEEAGAAAVRALHEGRDSLDLTATFVVRGSTARLRR